MNTDLHDAWMGGDNVLRLARAAAWACVTALAVLSWTPGDMMIRTGAPGDLEHVAAYLGTGSVAAVGYGARVRPWALAVLLCAWAGVLELGQLWVPGRHANVVDFAASSFGAVLGVACVALLRRK